MTLDQFDPADDEALLFSSDELQPYMRTAFPDDWLAERKEKMIERSTTLIGLLDTNEAFTFDAVPSTSRPSAI